MDYAAAVHAVQRGEADAAARMHQALTAISFVGPRRVFATTEDLTTVLRAAPIDHAELTVAYNEFIQTASIALTRSALLRPLLRTTKGPTADEVRAYLATLPPPQEEPTSPPPPD